MTIIYEPSEDSYLLSSVLQKQIKDPSLKVLEIGVGSGIQLETLRSLGIKNLLGADLNPDAVKLCKSKGFNCTESNLFSNLSKDKKFDLIIFNPPYLPKSENEDPESELITTGGKEGSELINKFLEQARNHLTKEGKIFLLTSSLTKGINFLEYNKTLLAEKKLFFEKLFVWELSID